MLCKAVIEMSLWGVMVLGVLALLALSALVGVLDGRARRRAMDDLDGRRRR